MELWKARQNLETVKESKKTFVSNCFSSKIVKEVAKLGGNTSDFVTPNTLSKLNAAFKS